MAGSQRTVIRETRRERTAFMAARPEEPPVGSQSVRSSEEAGNDRGAKGRRKRWMADEPDQREHQNETGDSGGNAA